MDRKAIVQIIKEVLEQQQNKQFNSVAESVSESEKTELIDAKTVIESSPELEQSLEAVDTQSTHVSIVDSEEYQQLKQQLKQQSAQFQQEINDLTETKNSQSNDLSKFKDNQEILEQQLLEHHAYKQTQATTIKNNQQTIDDLEQKNQHLQVESKNQHLKNSIHQAVSNGSHYTANTPASNQLLAQFSNLNYPKILTKEERFSVQKLVSKAGSREQDILDLLNIRLLNTVDPLNNRLSYFASLINRHRKGELDFCALESFQSPDDIEAKKAINTELNKRVDLYGEYHYKRVHYRNQLEENYSQYNQDYYNEFNNKAHAAYEAVATYVEKHQLDPKILTNIASW
jgi:hypothetical protein